MCKLFFKTRFTSNDFFRNHIVLWLLLFGLIANAADWTILLVFMNRVDAAVILHYNVYFGVDMLGSWKLVFIMPAVGLVLYLINAFWPIISIAIMNGLPATFCCWRH